MTKEFLGTGHPEPRVDVSGVGEKKEASFEIREEPDETRKGSKKLDDLLRLHEEQTRLRILGIRQNLAAMFSGEEVVPAFVSPELGRLCQEILEASNYDSLCEKSLRQVEELVTKYYGEKPWLKPVEYLKKRKKLKSFERFVGALIPIRADVNEYDEFLSPELSGQAKHYGPQDVLVHAERFVYGSFAEFGHLMTQLAKQHRLDTSVLSSRGQIVMNDVTDVMARHSTSDEGFLRSYVTNVFDFENGKKILALYFASIFESPEQVKDFFSQSPGLAARRWDRGDDDLIRPSEQIGKEKIEQILTDMKVFLKETGIEPPFSIEVRVKDRVKVLK